MESRLFAATTSWRGATYKLKRSGPRIGPDIASLPYDNRLRPTSKVGGKPLEYNVGKNKMTSEPGYENVVI